MSSNYAPLQSAPTFTQKIHSSPSKGTAPEARKVGENSKLQSESTPRPKAGGHHRCGVTIDVSSQTGGGPGWCRGRGGGGGREVKVEEKSKTDKTRRAQRHASTSSTYRSIFPPRYAAFRGHHPHPDSAPHSPPPGYAHPPPFPAAGVSTESESSSGVILEPGGAQ